MLPLPKHMPALDGLRGIAAMIVLVSHASAIMFQQPAAPRKYLAVVFFWMLSGFVIAHAYQARLTTGMSLREFLLLRVIRLYPLIVAGAGLSVTTLFLVDHRISADISALIATVAALFALPSPTVQFSFGHFAINPPEWSLFYEMLASALFGMGLYRMPTQVLAAIAAMSSLYSAAVTVAWSGAEIPLWMHAPEALASFTIGVLLFRLVRLRRFPTIAMPFWILASALTILTALPASLGWWPDVVGLVLVFPAIIILSLSDIRQGIITRFLGLISYPLYILHWPILIMCNITLVPRIGQSAAMVLACGMSIAVAWVALRLFDEPTRVYLTRLSVSNANRKVREIASA